MALAVAVAGLWALPVFSLPLLLTQLSFRRYAAVRTTYRQTIASLARATEIAGYTPAGHARRVAALSRAVGRELGLSGAELTVLEYAALMHDIGQLSLVDPVPAGATASLPPRNSAASRCSAEPWSARPGWPPRSPSWWNGRRTRTGNSRSPPGSSGRSTRTRRKPGKRSPASGPLRALEELRLGTARDYQPEVVESLARVLSRGGPAPGWR